ncbi:MAG: ATP-binding protein, partial [Candidatus Binatia bacterium]
LQSLAGPGSVLVSEATHRLVRGFFKVRPTGPLEIKGKAEPVNAYEVLGASDVATPMTVAEARGLTPLVGRSSELRQFQSCFELLRQDLPQVVSVVGDAGRGKSRLLYDFRQQFAGEQAIFFEARCSSMTQSLPYAPWVGMLKQFFGLRSNDPPDCCGDKVALKVRDLDPSLERLVPYLYRLLAPPALGPADRPAEEIREETFEAMAKLVMAASRRAPVVMMIEDLHWIDDPSREMLELAVSRLHQAPVMIAVSHRPDYQPAWRARVAFTQLHLRPLDDEDLTQIIRALAGGPLPEPLERNILVKAEGNPFFAEEITRALVDEGYLLRGERHVRVTRPVEQIRIPDTIQELIGARLDRLGASAKRVVQVAAVLGRQFRRDQVARLLESEAIDVASELHELEIGGVVHRKNVLSDDELRFGESLTQEVAYEGLLLKERRHLHERIALLLESAPDRTADHSALLAHHFVRSDNRQKAVGALLHAANDAETLPSFRSAAKFYRQAWEIAELGLASADGGSETFRRLAVDAAIGLCRMAVIYGSSDIVATEEVAPRALEIARSLGDLEKVSGLSVFRGLALASAEREKFAQGVAMVEQGLALAEKIGTGVKAVNVGRALAWAYILDGSFALAEDQLARMLELLERSGDRERLSDTYFGALYIRNGLYFFSDQQDLAEESSRELYELAVRTSNRTVQSGSAASLAGILFNRAEYAEAKGWADRALELAERIGNLSAIRGSAMIALGSRLELGEPCDRERYLQLVEQDFSGKSDMALRSRVVVEIFLGLGEVERARRFAETAFEYAGGRLREMICATAMGDVLRELGAEHQTRAAEWYARALALAEQVGHRSVRALATAGRAELSAAQGDREAAAEQAQSAREIFRALGLVRYDRRVERLLAKLSAAA